MTDPSLPLRSPIAGRYQIDRELGRGVIGTVYLAHDRRLRRPVALKVLRRDLAASLGRDRFLREVELAANLNHPHILPLHDSGEAAGLLFCVMPYVAGESLRERLTREGPLPVDESIRVAREVADALSYAHSHGLVHRDLKPSNILFSGGHAVVADFGIAVAVGAAAREQLGGGSLAVGTLEYLSPEQVADAPAVDGRSDLYALACVLYEMLTGSPPFTGPDPEAIASGHLHGTPSPLRQVRRHVPPDVERAVGRALAKVPADRFGTAIQFGDALALEAVQPPGRVWRRRAWIAGGGLLLAAAAALAVSRCPG